MARIGTEDGYEFDATEAWERIKDQDLVELAWVCRDMGNSQRWDGERAAVTSRAYHALADAATTLRLMRHGNDRLRERAAPAVTDGETEEWAALVEADTLHMLPPEALIASVRHLAQRLLDLAQPKEKR